MRAQAHAGPFGDHDVASWWPAAPRSATTSVRDEQIGRRLPLLTTMSNPHVHSTLLAYSTRSRAVATTARAATLLGGVAVGVLASRAAIVASPVAGAAVAGIATLVLLALIVAVLRRSGSSAEVSARARGAVLVAMLVHAALAGAAAWWLLRAIAAD